MRANEFLTERKKKRKSRSRKPFAYGAGYGYYYGGANDVADSGGGDGGGGESKQYESAVQDLADRLPKIKAQDPNTADTIDRLVKDVSKKHNLHHRALKDLFKKRFGREPNTWKNEIRETDKIDIDQEVQKAAKWMGDILNIQNMPKIKLSYDSKEAQEGHHTGRHELGSDEIWVYANNRNLVDILRTVFHELEHIRQGENDEIDPGSSYPGSPIEAKADMVAGKYIKIYGENNRHIFQ
jgi:hypothetical protein